MKIYRAKIVIAGGGPTGAVAAIAAARAGADVLVVEQYGCLGGMATMGSVAPWMTFHDKQGVQTIKGIPEEIVQTLVREGASRGHVPDTMGETSTITPFDPEALKELYARLVIEAGGRILFHTFIFGVEKENGKITALKAANKDGEIRIEGDYFIDGTGDADLAYLAGCPYEKGRSDDGMMQPVTMNFTMANVDFEPIRRYMYEHRDEFHFNTCWDQLKELPNSVSGFFSLWKKVKSELDVDVKRDRFLFFRGYRDDIATVNTTRVIGIDGTSAEDLTRAELEGRHQVMEIAKRMVKYLPGFENAYLLSTGSVIGVRETRRIVGQYVLTKEDLMSGRSFDDDVVINAYTIDVHQPDGDSFTQFEVPAYGIPFRSMLPQKIDNLIVAGRAISTTREAQGSVRTTPTCMAMGQAAGIAAALAAKERLPGFGALDVGELRRILIENGVYLR